jgi:hypothetical protein
MNSTGNTPQYIRHIFKVNNVLKTYSVYQFDEVTGTKNLLTDTIRIEKYFGKSNAQNIEHYLRLRNTTNWATSEKVTGLRPTTIKDLFHGNRLTTNPEDKQNKTLLLFIFSTDRQTLTIDVYRGFYPNHKGILQNIVNTYKTN